MANNEKRIATFDCETDPFKYGRIPKPFAWGFYDGETYVQFWGDDCTAQLLDYLKDEEELILYAHNGGKFDFYFILKHLDADVSIINGRIAKATLFDGKIQIRDSLLILPMALAKFNKDEIDYKKMEKEVRELHKPEISRYLQKDCTALYDVVKRFRDEFGGGLTLAGAAFKQLKLTDYPAEPTSLYFDNLFRHFYQGGRVQCVEVGAFVGDYEYVDINSAYPYAMTFKHWQGSSYREVLKLPESDNGSFFVCMDAVSYGCLPFRDIKAKKTYYPDDETVRTYCTSGWEVIAGLKTNTLKIKKIRGIYLPSFKCDFTEYVNKFFALKKKAEEEGDKTLREFAKLMLNSCYGKFGQDGRKFEKYIITEYGDVPPKYKDKDGVEQHWNAYSDAIDMMSIFKRPDPVERFYNVATAASITGFVRAYWWQNACASEGVIYGDTDSMLCKKFGGRIGDKLGEWKLEANIKEAYVAQRKMYAMLTDNTDPKKMYKVASKGVKLTYEQIKSGVLTGENVSYDFDAPAFNLKTGARFTSREINFKNLQKNACKNPAESYNENVRPKTQTKTITKSLKEILCL